jgi:glycosidase
MNEEGATIEKLELAFAFLLTARGIPMLYYGDEIGMAGGSDPDNRRDFPGGWKQDSRNAFEASGRTIQENKIFEYVRNLIALRSRLEPLRRGSMVNLLIANNAWVYARRTPKETVIVGLNAASQTQNVVIHLDLTGSCQSALGFPEALPLAGGSGLVRLLPLTAAMYVCPDAAKQPVQVHRNRTTSFGSVSH